ncbi:MAG: GumC family protein [Candidatus Tectimicrobiota bacterium]
MIETPTLPPPRQNSLRRRPQDVEYVILNEASENSDTSLLGYLRLIWRRKWLALLPGLCLLPVLCVLIATQPPRYVATATVSIEDTNPRVLAIPEVEAPERSPNFYNTQYEILKSRAVAEEVVDTLQLDRLPPAPALAAESNIGQDIKKFFGGVWQTVASWVSPPPAETPETALSPEEAAARAAAKQRQRAVGRLLGALTVEPRKGTKLVDLTLQGQDPQQVAMQVNALADVYARQNLEKRLEASRKASVWLQKEAESLRTKIAEGERRIQAVKEDRNLITGNGTPSQGTDLNGVGVMNLSYLDKRRERLALGTELDGLRQFASNPDFTRSMQHPSLLNNPVLGSLQTRYTNLQIQQAELAKKFMDKHPQMVRLATEMAEVRRALSGEVQRVIASLETQYRTLATQENQLQQAMNTQKNAVIRSEKDMMTYETLRRDLDIHKAMYLDISKRFAETTLTTALETNNVRVVEHALSGEPAPSGTSKYVLFGLVLSVACGGGLALLAEAVDKRFKNVAEVERSLALPFLGFVPHYLLSRRRLPALITLQKPWSQAAESYRTLRTWVQLARPPIQHVLVTSAAPEEGKSTTAANLAVSFAQLGQRVLLVDADLRKPSLHRLFTGGRQQGLAEVLAHGVEWQSVVRETPMENLQVLFAGSCPVNPAELLSMTRLQQLIETWKTHFDRVIFDSPVVLSIPDVMILAPLMDGVLLVHSQGRSSREMAIEMKNRLERAGARLIGMIFNNVRSKDIQHYSSYQTAHQYGATIPGEYAQAALDPQETARPAVLDVRATHVPIPPLPTGAVAPPAAPVPIVIDREGHSHGLSLTLHTVTRCRHIGAQQATAGWVFLILDLEIRNEGAFGHLFDPALATLAVREETDYGQALASFITIDGAEDDTARLQAARTISDYDPLATAHLGGWTAVTEMAAAHTSRGTLVYQLPEASLALLFVYSNTPVVMSIPFVVPPSSVV